jgi:mono/diheme cytochrome c family protein
MINALKIFVFTIVVVLFYSYVGQMVPQKITYPPEETEIGADLTLDEMVEIGQQVMSGKGTCLTCHTIGSDDGALRFPDLGNIGAVAGTRKEGLSDVEYIAESLYDPNAFIVEGFQAGMPTIHKPPINLTDDEILTVIAYLQSLGGTPTVTMDTELQWQGEAPTASTAAAAPAAAVSSNLDGPTLFTTYLCSTCHSIDNPAPLVGPSLYDVGARLSKAEITDALLEPDAVVAEGFPGGVMKATLDGIGFYDKVSAKDLNTLVDYLAAQQGE